jgi:phosphoglycerate kinase
MEKELKTLKKVVSKPEKPCVFLFGGAKFSDVIVTVDRLLTNEVADEIILSGLPANAFLKAKGYSLGEKNESILFEEGTPEQIQEIKGLLDRHGGRINLPIDFAIAENGKRREIGLKELPSPNNLFDIGEKTIERFKKVLGEAKTIFISGPCGVFENPLFKKGTEEIFNFIANSKAFSIAGGGHTVAAIEAMKIGNKISHISTGGGSLEKFMMGEKLPVVEALIRAKARKQ